MRLPQNTDRLTKHRVTVHEEKDDRFTLFFDCWAEDADHAVEQAEDAYPCGRIGNVISLGFNWRDQAEEYFDD